MAGKTLADGYLELRADASKLGPDVRKGIKAINADKAGADAGESFGAKFASSAKEKLSSGLGAGLGALGIGVGIGGALTSGIAGSLDIGAANDKLRAQLNLSAQDSAKLGKAAGDLYSSNYGDSMGDVNDAIASVIGNVKSMRNASVPELKDITGGALDIVRVFGQDMPGVTSAMGSLMRSGLAPDAQSALDIITTGFQEGLDKGGDFLDTLTEYSVQFTKLGLDGESSLGVINQLLAGGARSSDLAADAIKEFSIRAIDGSKTSTEGFKALGLNAKDMAKAIASGGPAAKTAFATVVDKLNSMKDPVKRNTAGVALFGTQWEDLGDAFRNLDVSAATDDIGKLAGATKGIADQSDQGRIQGFIRSLKTGFVNIVGGEILPRVTEFADKLKNNQGLMDGLRNAGDRLVGALKATGTAVSSVVGFFREHESVAKGLVVTMGLLLAVTQAHAAVMAVQAAGGLVAYISQIRIVSAATKIWTAIQWLLNSALFANPIGLIVLAIVALVAAIVIAYKNSETFRDIVQKAWQGIQAAVSYAWNNIIKPTFAALVGFVKDTIIPIVMWLWKNVMLPAWAGIQFAIKAAWVVIQIIFAAFKLYLTKVLFPIIQFLYNNVVKPVFSAVASTISSVWNKGIKPVLSALGGFIKDKVAPAFRAGVGAIAAAWDKVKEVASKPVRFVIDEVINRGIIGGINWLASKVGVKDRIPPIRWGGGSAKAPRTPSGRDNADHLGDGYGIGDGKGIGDGLGSLLAGPAKWLSDRLGLGRLASKFGSNPFVSTVTGAAGRAKDMALGRIQSLIGEFFGHGGGSVGAGGLRSGILGVLGTLRGQFGSVPIISGLRPGATTLSGNTSYHASGRAVDIAPVQAWAQFLHDRFGGQLRELITPWNDLNVLNGRAHRYTGAVWNQHNFAGGNAHIHAALDDGGFRTLMPGLNVIPNGTGAPEPIAGPAAMRQLAGGGDIHLHFHGPVASKQAAEDMVLTAVQGLKRKRKL